MKRVPVIILNWNGWDHVVQCLERLAEQDVAAEIWVADNGSEEDRTAELSDAHPTVRWFRWPENLGWAGGYNRALEAALAEGLPYAYLLNSDTRPCDGFLAHALATAARNPSLAAVGSVVLYDRAEPSVQFDGEYYGVGNRDPTALGVDPIEVDRVMGAAMLVRMDAYRLVGHFDERFFLYLEETDWCYRASAAGWKLAVDPASRVLHHNMGSDKHSNAAYYVSRNWFLRFERSGDDGRRDATLFAMLRIDDLPEGVPQKAPLREACIDGLLDGIDGRWGPRPKDGRKPVERVSRFNEVATEFRRHVEQPQNALALLHRNARMLSRRNVRLGQTSLPPNDGLLGLIHRAAAAARPI